MSYLLTEVHIALFKFLLREDEAQGISFGPLDQKDSINVLLHCCDSVTWPENLAFYLSSDPEGNKAALDVLANSEYPFTSLSDRLAVLQHLTDSVLASQAVREDLVSEGLAALEDHCRVCHKLGDIVVWT